MFLAAQGIEKDKISLAIMKQYNLSLFFSLLACHKKMRPSALYTNENLHECIVTHNNTHDVTDWISKE